MKNKILALVEIAIVLCSVFLVATLPAAAITNYESGITNYEETASEDDYVLGIYGNANEDDTIDMRDLTYVKLIFFGKKPETELADAKYDGKINPLDFIQIKLIIVGKEKELTIIDAVGKAVTIYKPIKRIVVCHAMFAEVLRSLGAEDKIVGIPSYMAEYTVFYPDLSKLPTVGGASKPDSEAILSLNPDLVIVYGTWAEYLEGHLQNIAPVARLTYRPFSTTEEDIRKLGYIVDREKEAEELIDFHEGYLSIIKDRIAGVSEDEKPRVYLEYSDYRTTAIGSGTHEMLIMAGGRNIAADLTGFPYVDPEWVIEQNPDIIIARARSTVIPCGYSEDDPLAIKEKREKIMNRPELAEVEAVKNEKVYCFTTAISTGLSYFIGIPYIARWLHPDLFDDLDPEAVHQEYLTRFQRLDYDLDEHGVFAYPPIEIDGGLAGIPDRYKGQN